MDPAIAGRKISEFQKNYPASWAAKSAFLKISFFFEISGIREKIAQLAGMIHYKKQDPQAECGEP